MVKDIISLVRPQQWLKNVFIFLPIFFCIVSNNLFSKNKALENLELIQKPETDKS